jgi:hypothetical protein
LFIKGLRSTAAALLAVGLVAGAASCGGKDDNAGGLPTLTPRPSSTDSVSPTSTPSSPKPTAEPAQTITKYGQLTLVFNQPATVDAKARPALKTYRVFQQTFRGMLGTDRDDPLLTAVAGPSAVQYVQKVLQNQRKDGDRLGGTLTVTAKIQQVGQAAILIGGCFDQSKSYGIRPNGSHYVADVVKKQPRLQVSSIASSASGGWRITDYRLESNPC